MHGQEQSSVHACAQEQSCSVRCAASMCAQVPPLKVYLDSAESMEAGSSTSFCSNDIYLNETEPVESQNSTWCFIPSPSPVPA